MGVYLYNLDSRGNPTMILGLKKEMMG
jgi:hypothetical protein